MKTIARETGVEQLIADLGDNRPDGDQRRNLEPARGRPPGGDHPRNRACLRHPARGKGKGRAGAAVPPSGGDNGREAAIQAVEKYLESDDTPHLRECDMFGCRNLVSDDQGKSIAPATYLAVCDDCARSWRRSGKWRKRVASQLLATGRREAVRERTETWESPLPQLRRPGHPSAPPFRTFADAGPLRVLIRVSQEMPASAASTWPLTTLFSFSS